MPPPEVSRNTFYKTLATLKRLKLIDVDGYKYTLRFDTLPLEVAQDTDVQKGFAARNRHNANLRTPCGIMDWAKTLTRKLLAAIKSQSLAEPEIEEKPKEIRDKGVSPYSLYNKIKHSPLDKSKGTLAEYFGDIIMGKRTAAQIMQDVARTVDVGREKITAKRKARRTLADRCALFEQEWARGQRDRDSSTPTTRIVGKDRALLKTQILRNAENTELDTDAFAYWVTNNWQAVGATYFAKAKSYPERPTMPWLVKTFETYLIAWQQREHLDTEGTRSQTELMKRSAGAAIDKERAKAIVDDSQREIAMLKAQLAERDGMIDKLQAGEEIENDMLDEDTRAKLKYKPIALPDYDDDIPAPKKRKLKRKRT